MGDFLQTYNKKLIPTLSKSLQSTAKCVNLSKSIYKLCNLVNKSDELRAKKKKLYTNLLSMNKKLKKF